MAEHFGSVAVTEEDRKNFEDLNKEFFEKVKNLEAEKNKKLHDFGIKI